MIINKKYSSHQISFYFGNALKKLQFIKNANLILTDPPYNLNRFPGDNFSEKLFTEFSLLWLRRGFECLVPGGLCFFTFWADGMYKMYEVIARTDFNFIQTIIWYYPNISGFKAKSLYVRTFDPIFVLSKDKPRKLTLQKGISSNDCWNMLKLAKPQSNFKKDKLIHPTQKPISLYERIVIENTEKGNLVVDPFAGSFTSAIACHRLKRNYIGIENNRKFFKEGLKRFYNDNNSCG